jgi:hypothetical protein
MDPSEIATVKFLIIGKEILDRERMFAMMANVAQVNELCEDI